MKGERGSGIRRGRESLLAFFSPLPSSLSPVFLGPFNLVPQHPLHSLSFGPLPRLYFTFFHQKKHGETRAELEPPSVRPSAVPVRCLASPLRCAARCAGSAAFKRGVMREGVGVGIRPRSEVLFSPLFGLSDSDVGGEKVSGWWKNRPLPLSSRPGSA